MEVPWVRSVMCITYSLFLNARVGPCTLLDASHLAVHVAARPGLRHGLEFGKLWDQVWWGQVWCFASAPPLL